MKKSRAIGGCSLGKEPARTTSSPLAGLPPPLGLGVWSPAFTVRSLTFRDGWGGFPVVPSALLNVLGTFPNGAGKFPNQPGTFTLGSATFPDRLGTFLNGSGSLQFTCRFLINTFQTNNLQA